VQMLIEMRADAFENSKVPVDEIAQRLPWFWGVHTKAYGRETVPERSVESRDEELDPVSRGLR
jgi:hypothetical protein